MAARDPVSSTTRDDTATRNRPLRAETPPADHWRRWADEVASPVDTAVPVSAAIIPAPAAAAVPSPAAAVSAPRASAASGSARAAAA
ncbi:GGDEF domain-containing response regulator, partial [Xanthomonas euvesicatoria pv. euvesicatoria]